MDNIEVAERSAETLTRQIQPEVACLFDDLSSVAVDGLHGLEGQLMEDEADWVIGAMMAMGLDSLRCWHTLWLKGYYLQAGTQARLILEAWLTSEYLTAHRYKARQWLDPKGRDAPHFKDMRDTLYKKTDQRLRDGIKVVWDSLNDLSHSTFAALRSTVFRPSPGGLTYRVGGSYEERLALWCADLALAPAMSLVDFIGRRGAAASAPWEARRTEIVARATRWRARRAAELGLAGEPIPPNHHCETTGPTGVDEGPTT